MEEILLECRKLSKAYEKERLVLKDLDLEIRKGELIALLGPNGAGKTTAISLMIGLLQPSFGEVRIKGIPLPRGRKEASRVFSVTFQEPALDKELTGRDALFFHGRLHGMGRAALAARVAEILELIELEEAAGKRISTYSGGMRRRLELGRGLLTRPELLFLDEPTLGVDPQNRARIWDYIAEMRAKEGTAILLTTHYLDEAERLADRVVIIDEGIVVAEGSPSALVRAEGSRRVVLELARACPGLAEAMGRLESVPRAEERDGFVIADLLDGQEGIVPIMELVSRMGAELLSVSIDRPSLNDVFLKLTGKRLRD